MGGVFNEIDKMRKDNTAFRVLLLELKRIFKKFFFAFRIFFIFIFILFLYNCKSSHANVIDDLPSPLTPFNVNIAPYMYEGNYVLSIDNSNGFIIYNKPEGNIIYREVTIKMPYGGLFKYYLVDENKNIYKEGEININANEQTKFTLSISLPAFLDQHLPKRLFLIFSFDRGVFYKEHLIYYESIYVINGKRDPQTRVIYNLLLIYNDLCNQISDISLFLKYKVDKISKSSAISTIKMFMDLYKNITLDTITSLDPYVALGYNLINLYHVNSIENVGQDILNFAFGIGKGIICPSIAQDYVNDIYKVVSDLWGLIVSLDKSPANSWINLSSAIDKVGGELATYECAYILNYSDFLNYADKICDWQGIKDVMYGASYSRGMQESALNNVFLFIYLASLIKHEDAYSLAYNFYEQVNGNNGYGYMYDCYRYRPNQESDFLKKNNNSEHINEMIFGKVAQPEIISIDTPTVVQKGNIAKIIVRAKNNGSKDAVYGSITVSFPYLSYLSGINVENNAGLNVYRREVGDSIYNNMCKSMVAKYPAIELGGSWKKGEEKDIAIDIDSSQVSVNELYLYIRSTMTSYGNPWCYYKNDPASGNILDQQNWKVYKKVIKINNPPNKPMVVKGPTSGYVDKVYYFSASDSDPDGDGIVYKFDWGDGHISSYSSNTQYHFWTKVGKYCIRVKAKDKYGAESEWSDYYCIDIANNASPTCYSVNVDINPASGGSVSKNPDKSCYNGDRVTLTATLNSGYKFSGWGGDCSFCGSSTSCTITVSSNKSCTANFELSSNEPPVIDSFIASPTSGNAPLTVTFTCNAHDPDGEVEGYDINYGDGYTDSNNNGDFTHTYSNSGSYTVICTVKDNDGNTASKTVNIKVNRTTTKGYVFHYTFDSCDATDSSANGYDGEIQGNPQCVDGVSGEALSFDGIHDWIKVDDKPSFKDFTLSMWFKTSSNYIQGLFQNNDGHTWGLPGIGIVMSNSNDLEVGYRAIEGNGKCEIHAKNMNLADGDWHFLALVRNTSQDKGDLYIDGELVGSCVDPAPDKIIPSQSYISIGRGYYYTRGNMYFKGSLDDVSIYNYALSSDDINNMYQNFNPNPKNQPPVIDSFTANPTSGNAPLTVTFTCSAHDPDGKVVEYDIDYGDGNTDFNSYGSFNYTYNNAGIYEATCSVKDLENKSVVSLPLTITVSNISANNSTPGDANGDGKINVQDVVTVINYIMTGSSPLNGADCNGDGKINVQDYVCIVNKILSNE